MRLPGQQEVHPLEGDSIWGRSQHHGIYQQRPAQQRPIIPSQTNAIVIQTRSAIKGACLKGQHTAGRRRGGPQHRARHSPRESCPPRPASPCRSSVASSRWPWFFCPVESHRHQISRHGTVAPSGNTGLGSREPPLTTFASTDGYTPLFYVCFCRDAIANIHS